MTAQVACGPPAASPGATVLPAPVCTFITKVAPPAKATGAFKVTAAQQVPPLKGSQSTIRLPTNFQIPPGTVLIRSNNGQLMLVSQQALARAQAQVQNSNTKPPASSNAPAVQICKVQNSVNQIVSNVPKSTLKPASLSAPLSAVSIASTFQGNPAILQTAVTPSNIAKMSSTLISKASASVPVPTVVRICTTPQSVAASQGTPTVIIRASTPSSTPIPTLSCSLTSTAVTTVAATGVSATSSTVTMVPVRTSSPQVTPFSNNKCTSVVVPTCTSVVVPATTVSSTQTVNSTLPVYPTNSNVVQSLSSSVQQVSNGGSLKLSNNICVTANASVASASIVSSVAPASPLVANVLPDNTTTEKMPASISTLTSNVMPSKMQPSNKPRSMQPPNATESLDNVKKCKNFLATLIKLASSGPQSPTMGQNVKNLVKNLLDSKLEPEEFTTKLYKELKSSPQPYLVPFLKKSLPSLRRLMPNSQEFVLQCGQPKPPPPVTTMNSLSFVKITPTTATQTVKPVATTILSSAKIQHPTSTVPQPPNSLNSMNLKQVVVQQQAGGMVKHVTALPPGAAVTLNKPGEKMISLHTRFQAGHLPPASVLKQITLPGNKVIPLQASFLPIKENGTACFREEDDINDVTSMAGVNLNEENACILATNSQFIGVVIRSCKDEPFLFTAVLQTRILDIGKKYDIKELNSDVMNLVSHATQERLRGLIEKLTVVAQHRAISYKQNDRHVQSSDVRAQLKYLEQLEDLERQRKNEEEREMLLRAAKSRANKEDPEQLRIKQKAKELQQLELEQLQYREANLTALAALGPRKKRPLESSNFDNVFEDIRGCSSSVFSVPKTIFVPRITRVGLRDLIFCMEQERMTKHSLALYRALLK
ncbi:transcription initiation factor TFIID subunit 4B [Gastrophryne carolinensis]